MEPQKNPLQDPNENTEPTSNPPETSQPSPDDISLSEEPSNTDADQRSTTPDSTVPPNPATPVVPSSEETPEVPIAPFASAGAAAEIVPPKRKKTKMIALIAGIVVLILGAGTAAAYFGYYVPNKPDNILNTALSNFFSEEKAKTVRFDGEVNVTTKDASEFTLKGTFEGASSVEGQFELSMAIDLLLTNMTFDVRSPDGKNLFFRVGGLEGLPQLLAASGDESAAAYAPLLASVNNQWYEINESLLKEWLGTNEFAFSQEDMDKLAKAYKENAFFKVKEKLANEKVNDVDSYHYKVVIDKDKLKGFITAVKAANVTGLNLTDEQVSEVTKALDSSNVDFNKYPVEVWIAKDTKMFNKFAFTYADSEATLEIFMNLTDYNEPVEVEKPEGAKSILEVLGDVFSNPMLQQSLEDEFPDTTNGSGVSL